MRRTHAAGPLVDAGADSVKVTVSAQSRAGRRDLRANHPPTAELYDLVEAERPIDGRMRGKNDRRDAVVHAAAWAPALTGQRLRGGR
jgi:hypothetical protein